MIPLDGAWTILSAYFTSIAAIYGGWPSNTFGQFSTSTMITLSAISLSSIGSHLSYLHEGVRIKLAFFSIPFWEALVISIVLTIILLFILVIMNDHFKEKNSSPWWVNLLLLLLDTGLAIFVLKMNNLIIS